jgi:hypothetical protein
MVLSWASVIRDAAAQCWVQRDSLHIFKAEDVLCIRAALGALLSFLMDVPDLDSANLREIAQDATADVCVMLLSV